MWILAAVVVLVIIFFVLRNSRDAIAVRTATVQRQDLISSIPTNGKVEPIEDFQPHAPAPGTVSHLYVALGDHVRKGQELLRLDDADAASRIASAQAGLTVAQSGLINMQHGGTQDELLAERADLASAQAQQTAAGARLTNLEALEARGAASPAEVAQARQAVTDAEAKISQIKARQAGRYSPVDLSAQRAQVMQNRAALSAAQSSFAGVDVHSPISGTVYSLPIAQFDSVNAGQALLDVADLSRLQVRAYFDEPEVGKLANGQPVNIVWEAKPDRIWHGHIVAAPTTIVTSGTRNVGECLISIDDANGDLLPNTDVTVKVTTSRRYNALSLPREALRTEGASNFVYKIVDRRLVRTPVQVGVVNLTRVEILGGLSEGDVVALGALSETDLSDGLRVKPQTHQ